MKQFKFALRYIARHWWQYVLGIAALYMVDWVNVYVPEFTGRIIDGLEGGSLDMQGAMKIVWMIAGMGLAIALGRFGWRFFIFGAARSIEREVRGDMYGHLSKLSMRYFNQHKTGDLMAHFTNDLMSVRQLLGMTVITAFDATVMLVLVLLNMIQYVSPKLTVVAIIPLLIITVGDFFYGKIMHKRFKARQEAFSSLTDQVQESISGIRVIKAFVQERKELYAFAASAGNAKEKNLNVVRLHALMMPVMDLIIGTSTLLTLLYGGYLAIHGEITVGQFVAFNSYVGMLVWPMMAVGECITSISQGLASLGRIHHIFEEEPEIVDGAQTNHDVTSLKGEIRLNHLTFAYPDMPEVTVLDDVSVTVRPGETLAILGRTGSGKSTVPSLLVRLYDVADGMITIDGHDLKSIPLGVLRENIACVPQDNFLFSDTLQNNIAFGSRQSKSAESYAGALQAKHPASQAKPDLNGSADKTIESVIHAAELACIHDNIAAFPEQYATVVGERGVTLSGGQKQRSSIARALMKDSPILILDDALSAVDTDTERKILDNLKSVRSAERTTIIVAHRISTIQDADHILVLSDGKVAEYGTHEELLKNEGLYKSLFDKQQLEKQLHEDHEEGGEGNV
ncbi:MAG: ABC transporter ATP-binding protein [Clostridiales bacterium]|nr:ABC transporter ATP-binding protein [Clostridiales bacterium]